MYLKCKCEYTYVSFILLSDIMCLNQWTVSCIYLFVLCLLLLYMLCIYYQNIADCYLKVDILFLSMNYSLEVQISQNQLPSMQKKE